MATVLTVADLAELPEWPTRPCRGAPLNAFFVVDGEQAAAARLAHTARDYCQPCPIRKACEQVGRSGEWGVWGGQLFSSHSKPRDLLTIKASRRRTAPVQSRRTARGTPCEKCRRPMIPRREWIRLDVKPAGHVAGRARGLCAGCYASWSKQNTIAKGA